MKSINAISVVRSPGPGAVIWKSSPTGPLTTSFVLTKKTFCSFAKNARNTAVPTMKGRLKYSLRLDPCFSASFWMRTRMNRREPKRRMKRFEEPREGRSSRKRNSLPCRSFEITFAVKWTLPPYQSGSAWLYSSRSLQPSAPRG